jgi:hypothetical protein
MFMMFSCLRIIALLGFAHGLMQRQICDKSGLAGVSKRIFLTDPGIRKHGVQPIPPRLDGGLERIEIRLTRDIGNRRDSLVSQSGNRRLQRAR